MTECLEHGLELGCHVGGEGAGKFFAGNFDADYVSVMTNAKLPEAHPAQCVFALLDDVEGFASDSAAILDTRRKASGRGLIPDAQLGALRQFADLRLGQVCFEQWRENGMLSCGLLSRSKIALVVGINAVGNGVECAVFSKGFHDGEQFVLAVKTA